jgi:preprotein translocase, secG subunit
MTITLVQVIFFIASLALCALILLQQPKSNGGMGALSGGASSTVFGARGAGSFLYKTTRFLAAVFFVGALLLGYLQNKEVANHGDSNILNNTQLETQKQESALDIPPVGVDNAHPASNTDVPAPARQ